MIAKINQGFFQNSSVFNCIKGIVKLTKRKKKRGIFRFSIIFENFFQKPIAIGEEIWYSIICELKVNERSNVTMKTGIHPNFKETTVKCACGEVFTTKSTKDNIKVDICSKCHPFFTGKQKFVDAGGRVDKFKKKFNLK